MSFEESLTTGALGVQLSFPEDVVVRQEGPAWAQLVDETRGVVWTCSSVPFPMSARPDEDAALRADAERTARGLFEQMWAQRRAELGALPGRDEPRTADEDWSALIELERDSVHGAPVLRATHRLAYEPEYELVAARVLIPLEAGTFQIVAHAVDTMTGLRESMLVAARSEAAEGPLDHPGQVWFDDPAHDTDFPDHALSRARRAQRWLLEESGLLVSSPALPDRRGPVGLRAAQCAIVPPPRYREIPAGVLPMSETMVNFCRIDLDADDPELFEVWYAADATVRPGDADGLRELAVQTCQQWVEEGAEDVRVETREAAAPDSFVEVECLVRFRVEGRSVLAVQRWISDASGRVWRLGVSGEEAAIPVEATRRALEEARASFRVTSAPPPKRRGRLWGRS